MLQLPRLPWPDNMPAQPFAALLFDLDGLMIDTESLSAQAWCRAAQTLQLVLQPAQLQAMVGLSTAHCLTYLAQTLPPGSPLAELGALARQHYHHALAHEAIPLKAGILPLLQWCQQQQLPRAVATATERRMADIKLARSGLAAYFTHSVCGDEVARSKPAPDVYLAAAHRLGLAPQQCIALEDSVHGAQAALAAGMRVIIVPDLATPPPELAAQALAVCNTLHSAQALLAGMPRQPARTA